MTNPTLIERCTVAAFNAISAIFRARGLDPSPIESLYDEEREDLATVVEAVLECSATVELAEALDAFDRYFRLKEGDPKELPVKTLAAISKHRGQA